jgi:hypothetical protein
LNLRYVICGGEALELQSLRPWFERHGDQRPAVVNMYGITETTVFVTYRVIRAKDLENNCGSVIGVPIPDLQLYLLDEHFEPVPLGVAGEICIGGAGLGRGYLNRPELTQEKFVADPFSSVRGARLYRSGDLARRTDDGELEYLGRTDHQVKIRGFRVELGEIESTLSSHPGIRESVVLAEDGPQGDKRLIAYVVPVNGAAAPDNELLRQYLARKLPAYMVPATFIPLAALPVTGNGKIDRRALLALAAQPSIPAPQVLPRTETEKSIASIWGELLGRNSLSVDDNFFHLGGHSLLATQVVARIEALFHIELCIACLFEAPTIAGLSQRVEETLLQQSKSRTPIACRLEARDAEELLDRINELSDAEVESLLGEHLSKSSS